MESADKELKESMMRYLLGDLPDQERERLEQEYFVNDLAWEQLNAVEDDLIDAYARGSLLEEQRRQFERRFLASPRRRARAEFASTLMDQRARERAADSPPRNQSSAAFKQRQAPATSSPLAFRFAWVFSALLLAFVAFVVLQNRRLRVDLYQMREAQTHLQDELRSLQQEVASKKNAPPRPELTAPAAADALATVSILLAPGRLRHVAGQETGNTLPVPHSPARMVLFLMLDHDEYPTYDVVLKTAEGKEIRRLSGLKSNSIGQGGQAVAVKLPPRALRAGDYVLLLSGKDSRGATQIVDSYTFSAVR